MAEQTLPGSPHSAKGNLLPKTADAPGPKIPLTAAEKITRFLDKDDYFLSEVKSKFRDAVNPLWMFNLQLWIYKVIGRNIQHLDCSVPADMDRFHSFMGRENITPKMRMISLFGNKGRGINVYIISRTAVQFTLVFGFQHKRFFYGIETLAQLTSKQLFRLRGEISTLPSFSPQTPVTESC